MAQPLSYECFLFKDFNFSLLSMDMLMTIKLLSEFKLEMLKTRQLLSNNSVNAYRTLFLDDSEKVENE